MPKFKRKPGAPDALPKVVEAEHFTEENKNRAFHFITCNCYPDWDAAGNPTIRLQTPTGEATAVLGDWIVKFGEGMLLPSMSHFTASPSATF